MQCQCCPNFRINDYRISNTMSSLPSFQLVSWGCSISVYLDVAILTGVVWVATKKVLHLHDMTN
jgi:hypothetical protein